MKALTSPYQSEEMAEIILRRSREALQLSINVGFDAYDLVIGDHTGNRGMTIASAGTGVGTIRFAPTTAANNDEGWIDYSNNNKNN